MPFEIDRIAGSESDSRSLPLVNSLEVEPFQACSPLYEPHQDYTLRVDNLPEYLTQGVVGLGYGRPAFRKTYRTDGIYYHDGRRTRNYGSR